MPREIRRPESLRLAADENIHRGVVEGLRADGHDVLTAADHRPGVPDEGILAWARAEDRILITSDRDFGRLLVSAAEASPPAVIYLRLPRVAVTKTLERLREVLTSGEQLAGHLIVIAPVGERRRFLSS